MPTPESARAAVSRVVEIDLGAEAHLDWCDMEESTSTDSRVQLTAARLAAGARLRANVITLRCGVTRNHLDIRLEGEGAECRVGGMAIADEDMRVDNYARVSHIAPYGRSSQMFKYVVDDRANCAFQGMIHVHPGAHHTDAVQNNRNILGSPEARMHTRPQLLIYCDDVKAGHGSATGQLDAEALFYMRTRGIPEAEARTMLMQAFMADVIDDIPLEPLRLRVRHLADMRLSGQRDLCGPESNCHYPSAQQ